jgi:hypothetical protein
MLTSPLIPPSPSIVKYKYLFFTLTLTYCTALLTRAEWTLMEDFENIEIGVYGPEFNPTNPFQTASNGGAPRVEIVSGTPGTGGNKAAWFDMGGRLHSAAELWYELDLPSDISINSSGTLFFRVWQENDNPNYAISFSKTATGDHPDDTALWSYFSGVLRHKGLQFGSSIIDAYNAGFKTSNPSFDPDSQTWYSYWIVINNSYNNSNEQPLGSGGYEIFRQGPGDTAPILMQWGDVDPVSYLQMRNKEYDAIRTFVIGLSNPPIDHIWLIDDIYFSDTACLSDPTTSSACESWCDYAVLDGWSHVKDWLGWVNVENAPWVFSEKLNTWLYMADCPDTGGGFWTYVMGN